MAIGIASVRANQTHGDEIRLATTDGQRKYTQSTEAKSQSDPSDLLTQHFDERDSSVESTQKDALWNRKCIANGVHAPRELAA